MSGLWGSEMISPKQHFERLEASLAEIMERVPEITIEMPLPKNQAKWNDQGNEWYVERNPDRWDLFFFDDERWKITGKDTFKTDDALLFALVGMNLGYARGREFRLEVMGKVSPEWREREERELRKLGR